MTHGHPVLATAPASVAVSTSAAKTHLRVGFSDDDTYIAALVSVATAALENETNRKFITQTWDWYQDRFSGASIRLPFGSLQSVTSVKYTESDDTESTVATTVYDVVTWEDPGRVTLAYNQQWPTATLRAAGGVVTRFVCGYGDAEDIPAPLIQALKLTIGHLYENRESVVVGQGLTAIELPQAAKALAFPYRIMSV